MLPNESTANVEPTPAFNSDDSANPTIAEPKAFPFFCLPAELRNNVYAFILEHVKKTISLKHVNSGTNETCSYFGLSTANKLVRAEFRPLLMDRIFKIKIRLRDYPDFVDTFYRSGGKEVKPLKVEILVGVEERLGPFRWGMTPLMMARASTRGLCLKFTLVRTDVLTAYTRRFDLMWTMSTTLSGACRGLLREVASGRVADVQLKTLRYNRPELTLVVVKKAGGLRDQEIVKFERYCHALQGEKMRWGYIVDITIKVVDSKGKHVEEWWAYRGEMLFKKTGKDWWDLSVEDRMKVHKRDHGRPNSG